MSLEKASLFAPGSKANPNSGYEIERAVLHVWISQRPPLSLYMSTGFTPVRLIPDYYTAQDVQGGYEMQLSLPYMPVEDKLRAALAKQSTSLRAACMRREPAGRPWFTVQCYCLVCGKSTKGRMCWSAPRHRTFALFDGASTLNASGLLSWLHVRQGGRVNAYWRIDLSLVLLGISQSLR